MVDQRAEALDLGLEDGKGARVTSEAGSVEAVVEVSDEIRPGVVSLPHGWGHDRPGTRLAVARELAGSGVTVAMLAPGPVQTEFLQAAGMDEDAARRTESEIAGAGLAD